MKNWVIDRLTLTAPGYSEPEARELAHCIVNALAEMTTLPGPLAANAEHTRLELELRAQEGEAMPQLARRLVAALAVAG